MSEPGKTLDVALLPTIANLQLVTGSVAIIVDVLRASSTMVTALSHSAKQVIPVIEPEEAKEMAKRFPIGEVLLCGERGGEKIPGFDLGNSPYEFTEPVISRKTLIMSTTNGTKACHSPQNAGSVLIGCFLNLSAVCAAAKAPYENIQIITSGKENRFSLEDMVCAGAIVEKLNEQNNYQLTDSARVSQMVYIIYRSDLRKMLAASEHGKYLSSLGYTADLEYCAQVDIFPLVPQFTAGIITR